MQILDMYRRRCSSRFYSGPLIYFLIYIKNLRENLQLNATIFKMITYPHTLQFLISIKSVKEINDDSIMIV